MKADGGEEPTNVIAAADGEFHEAVMAGEQ